MRPQILEGQQFGRPETGDLLGQLTNVSAFGHTQIGLVAEAGTRICHFMIRLTL